MKNRILAIILTVVMLSALLAVTAYADGYFGEGDTLTWAYDASAKTLTIGGAGAMPDFDDTDDDDETPLAPWASSEIEIIVIGDSVTKIGANSFTADSYKSLTIPCKLEKDANLPAATEVTLTHDSTKAVSQPAKAATYTETGTIEYYTCSDCSRAFTDKGLTAEATAANILVPMLSDTTAPELTGITITVKSLNIYYSKVEVPVSVLATDAQSGVKNGTLILYNSAKNSYISTALTLGSGIYQGTLVFPEATPTGTYTLYSLTLTDAVGNSREYTAAQLAAGYSGEFVNVNRGYLVNPTLRVDFGTTTSCGYGGTLYGKVIMTDSSGYGINGKYVDVYAGTTKLATVVTGAEGVDGTITFPYYNNTPGTYQVYAKFNGDTEVNTVTSSSVSVTFTTTPATGDSYDVLLWSLVIVMALGVNVWYFYSRKRA